MSDEISRREPTDDELSDLRREVHAFAWRWARPLAGFDPGDHVPSEDDANLTEDHVRGLHLSRLAILNEIGKQVDVLTDTSALLGLRAGASLPQIADARGVTRQAAEQRWGHWNRGENVAVVISRRDRVRQYAGDRRGTVGEVGGTGQYASDRGIFAIGQTVRAKARHAIVAVDGTVRRIYALDPDGWRKDKVEPNKWEFTAIEDRELTKEDIDAAYAAGELPLRPGDDCPTKVGGAYRPHWF